MRGGQVTIDPHAALRASPLLRDFTEVGLRILAQATTARTVGRDTYAFRAGEASSALAFITRGTLQLLPRDGGLPLGEIGAGDTAAGLSLLAGGDHLVSAMALTEVELLELSADAFAALQQSHPRTWLKLNLALARDLAERLRAARSPLREFLVWQISKRQTDSSR